MRKWAVRMSVTNLMLTVFVIATTGSSLFAQLKPKVSSAPDVRTKAAVPDNPRIAEFSARPANAIRGRDVVLRWKVEPGSAGSPIVSVNIVRTEGTGPNVDVHSVDLAGEHRVSIPSGTPEGRSTYALTAVNKAGLSAIKTVSVEITGPPDLVVKEIKSRGLAVGFSISNAGRGYFQGKVTIRVSVNGSPGAIRPDRFREILKLEDGLYEVRDIQIPPGVDVSFGLLHPESREDGWFSGTYNISVQLSTDNTDENPGNNEKRVALTHSGVRRGTPTFDLYILGQLRLDKPGGVANRSSRNIGFTIFNTGPAEASNIDWEVRILDMDQVRRGESGLVLKAGTISRLAPGSTDVSFLQNLIMLGGKPMLLRAKIDPEDKIFEKDETNNKQELGFKF